MAKQTPQEWGFSGIIPALNLPAAGDLVDGVTGSAFTNPNPPPSTLGPFTFYARASGQPFLVETSTAFSAGASLVTDSSGRLGTGSGTVVAIALQGSVGGGNLAWCKWV